MARARVDAWAVVPPEELRAALAGLAPEARARYSTDEARGAVAVALAYDEGPAEPPGWASNWLAARPGKLASIGRFARANWYRGLVFSLKLAAGLLKERCPEGRAGGAGHSWPCLANSGLPEKRLALAAGLGSLGRHGLVMVEGLGPGCVLGLLLTPVELPLVEPRRGSGRALDPACEGCGRCVAACPTGALGEAGPAGEGVFIREREFIRERCLQHWSALAGPLPGPIAAAWGDRLYGCDRCLEACPRFAAPAASQARPGGTRPRGDEVPGRLGPGLPAAWLVEAPEAEIRSRLRGSALGLSWMSIEAFKRNAALVLASRI